MRSASDLTARARIRDAALELFGEHGYERTSLREIAQHAGVSPPLIVHHFGSKEGLRRECDHLVTDELFARKDMLRTDSAVDAIRIWLQDIDSFRPLLTYIARMLISGTEAGGELFAAFLRGTRQMIDEQIESGLMREIEDREAVAAHLTIAGLAPLVLQQYLARALGAPELSSELYRRSTLPLLDLYTHGLYTDDRFLVLAREALERNVGPRSDKGEADPNQDPDPPHGR